MPESAMTPDASPHRGPAAPFRIAIGLALAASAGIMLWSVGTHYVSASELGRETPMTLEDRVAALATELAQVKAENAKLRENQSDTSEELSHFRASLANAEIGVGALRTTTDENEAHRLDTAAQIAANLAQVKAENAKLRENQSDTATEIGSLRAAVDSLRATTGEIRQQIQRIESATDATGSIAKSHKHQRHNKSVAQR